MLVQLSKSDAHSKLSLEDLYTILKVANLLDIYLLKNEKEVKKENEQEESK